MACRLWPSNETLWPLPSNVEEENSWLPGNQQAQGPSKSRLQIFYLK